MRFFGFEITKSNLLSSASSSKNGWYPYVREPYSGAWQNSEGWTVDSVLAYHAVYSCITLIATDVGKLSPSVVKKTADGIWEESGSHLNGLLRKPNKYQNHIQFKEWWITSKLINGNTYILKRRDIRGKVVALYILDPSKVVPLVSSSGDIYYQMSQDSLSTVSESSLTIPSSEIIHDRMNCLYHPLVGISPLFASGLGASQGLAIQADSKSFWANGANPGGVLTAPGSIGDETATRIKEYWMTNFTGSKSGKVAVLGDGLKYEGMRMKSVDAQLIDQLRWTAEIVCSTFHVPAYKIGVGQMPTHDNIDALTQDYYSQCLQTHIENMEISLDIGLDVSIGYKTQLDLDALFRMDGERKMRMLGEGVKGSLLAPNEGRKKLNLPPLDGGDSVYLQQQNYSLEALAARDATNPLAINNNMQQDGKQEDDQAVDDSELTPSDEIKLFTMMIRKELAGVKI